MGDSDGKPADVQAFVAELWVRHRPEAEAKVRLLKSLSERLASNDDIDPDTLASARQAAHSLAGSLGTFGFPSASELARELELLIAERECFLPAGATAFARAADALEDVMAQADLPGAS